MVTVLMAAAPRAGTAAPLGPRCALIVNALPGAPVASLNPRVVDDPTLTPDLLQEPSELADVDQPIGELVADLHGKTVARGLGVVVDREALDAIVRAPLPPSSDLPPLASDSSGSDDESGLTLARVPEPASILLLGAALTALAAQIRARRH